MTTVTIRVGGRDYRVACDDGQEEHLRVLADDVDDRVRSLVYSMGDHISEGLSLVMAALTMADELTELKRENERLRAGGHYSPSPQFDETRMRDMEAAMAATLDDIASRIEKMADQIETR